MDLSIHQSQIAGSTARPIRDPEPVTQRESMEAPAKRAVADEATVTTRSTPATEVAVADYAKAADLVSELSSRIPAEPGPALGAQAQLPQETALALLR